MKSEYLDTLDLGVPTLATTSDYMLPLSVEHGEYRRYANHWLKL